MEWLPHLSEVGNAIRTASSAPSSEEALLALAGIAGHRLGFLDTIKLDKALGKIGPGSVDGFKRIKLAVIGSTTLDHLAPAIRVAGLRHRLLIEVYVGAFGQYRQEILEPNSDLVKFAPQFVVFSMAAPHVVEKIPFGQSADEVGASIGRSVDEIRFLWRVVREKYHATVIQQTFLDVLPPIFGSYDCRVAASPSRIVSRLNEEIISAAGPEGALLLDIGGRCQKDGLGEWYDVTRWLQAKQEIAPQAAPLYGDLLARILTAQLGQSRKCLVLDLDNTLWGGVIGDDGLDGIVLGQGSAAGEAHLALQHYALALKERGIILAVCSKNTAAVAESVFREHGEMALRRTDIAAFVANWNDKAENLRAIATQLNIGLDSLVFVDDNPAERARVREALPAVAVPEMPEDPAYYVRVLANAGYFEAVALTAEDMERAGHYAANAEREALKEQSGSMEDYLRGLNMSAVYGPFRPQDLSRVTQLLNKTNQFNTTTRRYSLDEVTAFSANTSNITLQFRMVDRFGDAGLVSAMLIRPADDDAKIFEIENWVMSCRVFGRELEYEAMNIAANVVREAGAGAIRANYIPTAKNSVIKDLYAQLGFQPVDEIAADDSTGWFLDLSRYEGRTTQITGSKEP